MSPEGFSLASHSARQRNSGWAPPRCARLLTRTCSGVRILPHSHKWLCSVTGVPGGIRTPNNRFEACRDIHFTTGTWFFSFNLKSTPRATKIIIFPLVCFVFSPPVYPLLTNVKKYTIIRHSILHHTLSFRP